MCAAIAPLMKNGPVQYCLSPGYHPAAGSYVFSASASSIDQVAAVVRYYRLKGWTRIAAFETTDASGQDGDRAIAEVLDRPENREMKLVAQEHFNPTDVSVAAQIERIKASGAQALISWSTGAPVATVFKGAVQAGLDIPIAPTSGNQTFAQMEQWASFLPKQLLLPSALFPPHEGIVTLDPRVETVQREMYAALKERISSPTIWLPRPGTPHLLSLTRCAASGLPRRPMRCAKRSPGSMTSPASTAFTISRNTQSEASAPTPRLSCATTRRRKTGSG